MAEARQSVVNLRQIEFHEIHNREIVGRGSFGTVYKAEWQNRYVAVKEFYITADQKAIQTEVKQLSRVVHPNIIALYGVSIKDECVYIVMEYAEGGSLYNFLHGKTNAYYSAAHAMNWALQCAEGVAYLHAMKPKPIIHRDLKPPNLLLVNYGRNVKICDFGTAADKSTWMTNNQGSAAWMAPEVFEGSHYSEKCDVFSWGIILWELLTRQQPFKDVQHALSILWGVHKGNRPPIIEGCPKPIEDLYTSCWSREPSERPSMQHVVKIMTLLCEYFPGADKPLDCKDTLNLPNKEHSETDATIDNNRVSFSPWSSIHSSQKTPTNSESVRHLTNMFNNLSNANSPSSPGKKSPRFNPSVSTSLTLNNKNNNDRISDEKSDSWGQSIHANDPFRLKPSQETANRNETIRNGILKRGNLPMTALSVDIDPNAWALKNENITSELFKNESKSDNKQRLIVTGTKPVIPENDDDNDDVLSNACAVSVDDDDYDDDYAADQSLHQMLDPSLQPEPPIPNNRLSQEIYQDHTRLAKEYLRVDTELYYATDRRDKYLASLDPEEREQKIILMKKLEEKEELLELYNDLKQQLERIRASQKQQQQQQQTISPQSSSSSDPQTSRSVNVLQSQVSCDSLAADPADDGWVLIPTKENNT